MSEPILVPLVYRCGHSINIVSPGESDLQGELGALFLETGQPVTAEWADRCWLCGDGYKTKTPDSVIEELRKAKYGH